MVWKIAAAVAVSAMGLFASWEGELAIGAWFLVLDLALGAVAGALVGHRHRRPVAVALATGVLTLVSVSASGPNLWAVTSLARGGPLLHAVGTAVVGATCWLVFAEYVETGLSRSTAILSDVTFFGLAVLVGTLFARADRRVQEGGR